MVLDNLVWEQINMLMQPPKNESRRNENCLMSNGIDKMSATMEDLGS